ncbi:hypothetical protein HA402_012703 [Bradysia odoriphaga]|nr:hypothetical protein HA402_012703 [Bradysia odoriphaga]
MSASHTSITIPYQRSSSPEFSDTLNNHLFITHVIPQTSTRAISTERSERDKNSVRCSLEEISKDIQEIEDFITVTEDIIKREKERDKEFYARERQRRFEEIQKYRDGTCDRSNKENKSPPTSQRKYSLKSPIFKINSARHRKSKSGSPNKVKRSRLYFKNGRIGCMDSDDFSANIQSTHQLVKEIIQSENNSPLVSPENVNKILTNGSSSIIGDSCDYCELSKSDQSLNNGSLSEEIPLSKMFSKINLSKSDNSEIVIVDSPIVEDEMIVAESPNMCCEDEGRSFDSIEDRKVPTTPGSATSINSEMKTQVRNLVRRFTLRTSKMQKRLEMPPTPSSSPSPPPQKNPDDEKPTIQLVPTVFVADNPSSKNKYFCCPESLCGTSDRSGVLDPHGWFYISWLCVVSWSFLYNAWVIPLRSSFPFQTPKNTNYWLAADFCADVIYLLDVIFIKHRIMYLYEEAKMDILSLVPLDLLYMKLGTGAVYLRSPRLLKIQSFWEFFKLLDRSIPSPHMVRVAKTLTYMLYMIHLTACTYFAYSDYQGLGTDRWVFSGRGHPYVRCFAFATKTATSIGKNPKPDTEGELLFMTAAWLMGVFVFALLIGQIRDIIATATRSQSEYRQLVDETLEYMRRLNLPSDMQSRVKMWFKFTWEQQRTLDEGLILDYLPANLKTDIAISVHIQTLSKVQLFADCEEALLRELVLKLRSVIFLPGDYICRKGEVGKEMYIVKTGSIQVMGGIRNDEVLATLSESSVFGEISLLAITGPGGNRRTADVRSKGFSNLFVLSKSDLNEAIVYYPNAQAVLKRRAKSLVRRNAAREKEEAKILAADVVIGNPQRPPTPPKLLQAVIQALPDKSPAVRLLTQGSKRGRKNRTIVESDEVVRGKGSNEIVVIEHEKSTLSRDLLESIQKDIENNQRMESNLTDSEKALLAPKTCDGKREDGRFYDRDNGGYCKDDD